MDIEKNLLGSINIKAYKKNNQKINIKSQVNGTSEVTANMVVSLLIELKKSNPRAYLALSHLVMQAEKEGKL